MTTGDLIISGLLLLLARKGSAVTAPKKQAKAADALDRISKLQARANQATAQAWIPDLVKAGASPALAAMLARWIGIESSGIPTKPSPAGEYGLLQLMPSTVKDAGFTPAEWAAMKSPATSRDVQAHLALKQFAYHQARAEKTVPHWPGNAAGESVFYSKLHHARPADLKAIALTGNARADAAALTAKWKNDPAALVRLAAANVITWGTATP
jgi:hypothetical protein